jgi:cysteine-rich repeat protein
MQRARPSAVLFVLASACGPLVAVDDVESESAADASSGANEVSDGGPVDTGEAGGLPPGDDGGEIDGGDEVGTGSMQTCGDGIVDPGEDCDDGNADPGDGCELDCTATPGLLLWSQTFDGEGNNDAASAVAVAQTGEVLVAGTMRSDGSDDLWLLELTADVSASFEHGFDPGDDDAFGTSVAITPDGIAYVAGLQPGSDRAVLLNLGGNGLVENAGAPTDVVPFTALVSPTAEGFVLVTNAGGFAEITATVRRYDSAGNTIADVVQPPDVFVVAATPSIDGGTILGGGSFSDMGTSSTWLARLSSDGSAVWSVAGEAEAESWVRLRGLGTAPDGRIVAVGTRGLGGPNDDEIGWFWWWSADGQPQDDGPIDIGGAAAWPNAVVVGAHGIVVGGTAVEDGFVAGFAEDGALQWGFELAGDLGLEDGVAALALAPGLGIVAVGWITQSTTNQDAWVGVFSD